MSDWINVADGLPEGTGDYLCACRDEGDGCVDLFIMRYWKHGTRLGKYWSGPDYYTITHWMPLPKLPETDND